MREYKASTASGKRILAMGNRCTHSRLSDVYKNWSNEKERAFEWCREQFSKTEHSWGFAIGSANTFGFTASWIGIKDGENIMRVETKDNSYLVWLDR